MNHDIHHTVRESYGQIARQGGACCGPTSRANGGCGPTTQLTSAHLGYADDDLAAVPEGADLGLGCGNPHAIAALAAGETVLDLGSGPGLDAFLAARQVGPSGRVIGVDMTAAMIERARGLAAEGGYEQVEFRLGELEHLPVADDSVDVILSNCVINLVPDKAAAIGEAYRVLRAGGRLAISDVVATASIPDALRDDLAALVGCVAGASPVDALRAMLEEVGFSDVRIEVNEASRELFRTWLPETNADAVVASATIEATKPADACCSPTCCP